MTSEYRQWVQLPEPWRISRIPFYGRPVAQQLALARQAGFIFDDNTDNWYIIIDGKRYNGEDNTITNEQWADPYRKLGDYNPNNDEVFVFNATGKGIIRDPNGTYVVRLDANGDEYYFNELGQRIYSNYQGDNAQADAFINRTLGNRSDLLSDPDLVIVDILGNPIVPKTPVHGIYQTVTYFEEVAAKRKQYIEFYTKKDKTILLQRAKDIISQQESLIFILNGSGVGVKKEAIFMGGIALTLGIAAKIGAGVPFAGKLIGLMAVGATARPVADRAYAQQEDLIILQQELDAIEKYVNSSLVSGDVGAASKKTITTPQIIVLVLIVLIIMYLIWRYARS